MATECPIFASAVAAVEPLGPAPTIRTSTGFRFEPSKQYSNEDFLHRTRIL